MISTTDLCVCWSEPVGADSLEWRPHDFRRIFVTDALRSGLPPHIAAKICGHALLDTTMGYAAIYPEDVITHHRAFIARRQTERPSEEYRDLTACEWEEFLAHFEVPPVARTPAVWAHTVVSGGS